MRKIRLGIFKYSCCAGCQFQFFFFQEQVLQTLGAVDILYCKMGTSGGVTAMGITYVVATLLFLVLAQREKGDD